MRKREWLQPPDSDQHNSYCTTFLWETRDFAAMVEHLPKYRDAWNVDFDNGREQFLVYDPPLQPDQYSGGWSAIMPSGFLLTHVTELFLKSLCGKHLVSYSFRDHCVLCRTARKGTDKKLACVKFYDSTTRCEVAEQTSELSMRVFIFPTSFRHRNKY